jgi:hypothetical protein
MEIRKVRLYSYLFFSYLDGFLQGMILRLNCEIVVSVAIEYQRSVIDNTIMIFVVGFCGQFYFLESVLKRRLRGALLYFLLLVLLLYLKLLQMFYFKHISLLTLQWVSQIIQVYCVIRIWNVELRTFYWDWFQTFGSDPSLRRAYLVSKRPLI